MGLRDLLLRRFTHRLLVRASVPHHTDVSRGMLECPHNLAPGFFQRVVQGQGGSHSAFYNLLSEFTHYHFYSFLFIRVSHYIPTTKGSRTGLYIWRKE